MVKDGMVKELKRLLGMGRSLKDSSRMAEMSEKSARKYRDQDGLPSQQKKVRDYRTKKDAFADVWSEVQQRLEREPRLKSKTLFEWLQGAYPGQFPTTTSRTFERRVHNWKSLHGPGKTVFFSQVHQPGRLAASDFTVCNELGVTIAGHRFEHMFYHCVLTYSNVESVRLSFSESFEALSAGIQKAFWEFGGVPRHHRSDSLAAAVRNHTIRREFTERYSALMTYYRCDAERTNARCANENGDVESSHGKLKDRIDQALMLRGSRDFESREAYVAFVEELVQRANENRQKEFHEEKAHLSRLPDSRLDTDDVIKGVRVSKGSTITVRTNTYSVPSRFIDETVDLRISAETITVTHQGERIQTMPRLIGKKQAAINYRHIIDTLVRKPGAFASYRHREELFPTSVFRMAWDHLRTVHTEAVTDKLYVQILHIAAQESQDAVANALRFLLNNQDTIDVESVRKLVANAAGIPAVTDIHVDPPDLHEFDSLLTAFDKECPNHDESIEARITEEESFVDGIIHDVQSDVPDIQPDIVSDQSIEGPVSANDPQLLSGSSDSSCDREPEPLGLSVGTDDTRMRDSEARPDQAIDDAVETPDRQDVGFVRLPSITTSGDSSTGVAEGWLVSPPVRKRVDLWETRLREEPRSVCVIGATDSSGTQPLVHDVQPPRTTTPAGQERLTPPQNDQATVGLRRTDHRRPRLRATKPRRNGSPVHPVSRTLRARQCSADKQPGLQQMGSDFQRRHDHRRSHRSTRPSQRHHRIDRPQLSSRISKEGQNHNNPLTPPPFPNGNSNCR